MHMIERAAPSCFFFLKNECAITLLRLDELEDVFPYTPYAP